VRAARPAVLAAAAAVACSGESAPRPHPEPLGPACVQPGTGLEGYVLFRRGERRYNDHVGVRMEFRHPSGRRIYFLLGIPGEIGEGLPLAGAPRLLDGSVGRLLGEEDRWALVWQGDPPCEDMAVVGNLISKSAFRRALRAASILP
jgi:hypothetical protein